MGEKKYFSIEEIKRKLEGYCVYQDRCHQEVEKKISEYQVISEARELILLHLMEHDFLNEERFAKSFARGKFRIKKWGKKRIVQELKFKNISEYNIKSALKEIDDDEYMKTLEKAAISKNKSIQENNAYIRRQKLYQHLYRKGYESSLIGQIISKFLQ